MLYTIKNLKVLCLHMLSIRILWFFFVIFFLMTGCAGKKNVTYRLMEVTGYCGCSKCCNWERGSLKYLKLNFWNRYISHGKYKGKPYSGLTASGIKPRTYRPGLFSKDSLKRPWMIPIRIMFFPWLLFSREGSLAADTKYYPFGTKIYIPGYGYGIVEDRGSAIKGKNRLDAYFGTHRKALIFGRQKIYVRIFPLLEPKRK